MNAQEKIQIINEVASSNLSDGLKLKLIREAAQEAAQAAQTDQAGKKPRKAAQAVKREGRALMKYITRELLESCAGSSQEEIVSTLSNLYPEKEIGTIKKTTIRRLKGEDMNLTENEEIIKKDDLYFLIEKPSIILT